MIVIPFGVISWIILGVVRTLWQLHTIVPDQWKPENVLPNPGLAHLINLLFTVGAAFTLAICISFVGWSSKQFIGRKILEWIGDVIQHIPLIRSIYSALDQLLRTLASGGGKQFNRVVYVEYPRKGVWTIAFVTGPAKGAGIPEGHLNIYVPTTPNPTSGFHLIVPEADVKEAQMKVEEAFKTILSLGIAQNG